MTRTLLFALLLAFSSPLAAETLPQDDVERLLQISTSLRQRGFPQAAQDVYDAATDCLFCGDDHPERLRGDGLTDKQRCEMCAGRADVIADDDPALAWFRTDEGLSLEDRKVALAIERVNSCD